MVVIVGVGDVEEDDGDTDDEDDVTACVWVVRLLVLI